MFPARHSARDFIDDNGDGGCGDDGRNHSIDYLQYECLPYAVLSSLWAPYLIYPTTL